mmetsp:Transcript_36539/g.105251  ORF Transcript_36539/g.105251 Transcript_36539/m.105251 type:complete len:357 (-) Transcript_36539:1311-2381(-)
MRGKTSSMAICKTIVLKILSSPAASSSQAEIFSWMFGLQSRTFMRSWESKASCRVITISGLMGAVNSEIVTLSGAGSCAFSSTRPSPGFCARIRAPVGSPKASAWRRSKTFASRGSSTWKVPQAEPGGGFPWQATRTQGEERPRRAPSGSTSQSSVVRAPTRSCGAMGCSTRQAASRCATLGSPEGSARQGATSLRARSMRSRRSSSGALPGGGAQKSWAPWGKAPRGSSRNGRSSWAVTPAGQRRSKTRSGVCTLRCRFRRSGVLAWESGSPGESWRKRSTLSCNVSRCKYSEKTGCKSATSRSRTSSFVSSFSTRCCEAEVLRPCCVCRQRPCSSCRSATELVPLASWMPVTKA